MMAPPDYIVIRRSPDLPDDFNTGDFDGKWLDRGQLPVSEEPPEPPWGGTVGRGVAVPTGRFETREDGAVAEIWEIRP